MASTVYVTFSLSQDFPVPNGAPSVTFSDLDDEVYTVAVYNSAGNLVGTQTLATVTQPTATQTSVA